MKRRGHLRLLSALMVMLLILAGCEGAAGGDNASKASGDQIGNSSDHAAGKPGENTADSQLTPADPAKTYESRTLGIIYPMANSTYESITQHAEETAAKYNAKLLVQAPDEANLEQQIRIMETMIKQKLDGIAIDPVDADALTPVINKAVASGIPVICFESDSPRSNRLAYVGADNYETGRRMGILTDQLLDGEGMVLVETGMSQMHSLTQRLEGLLHYLNEHTKIDVLEVRYNEGSETRAMTELETMIDGHPHFNAFLGLDFISGASSVLIWKAKGLKRNLITLGLNPDVEEGLRNGQVTAAISQNESNWGETIVQTLVKASEGEAIEPFIDTGIVELMPAEE
ncbi:ribose transport system substrate-binding protein [Paenibacillus phyllosphaerae]|uniref:Ribose transport system substrate-binding protein n=1 Tax=Paenibacillus phyllosphaerae TaxID=274593 RepID=A0A7W5B1T5_9BACL|nr:ribose transport system substrate-binding protein [Paenibacillus phyllosphaerae]